MRVFRFAYVSVVFMTLLAPQLAKAQNQELHGLRVRELHPQPTSSPFSLAPVASPLRELNFLKPENMSHPDRALIEANQQEISLRAARQGFLLGQVWDGGEWAYEQAVCPAFPQHVILQFRRMENEDQDTLFSVVIPRGEGHVRVIPARRRGFSLFTPVASNEITVNDFNHIVVEEGLRTPWHGRNRVKAYKTEPTLAGVDWLTLGLCYSALASGHIRAGLVPTTAQEEDHPLRTPAQLRVSSQGGAEVWVADTTPGVKSMTWELRFAQDGRLMRVRHVNSTLVESKELPKKADEVRGVPLKEGAIDLPK